MFHGAKIDKYRCFWAFYLRLVTLRIRHFICQYTPYCLEFTQNHHLNLLLVKYTRTWVAWRSVDMWANICFTWLIHPRSILELSNILSARGILIAWSLCIVGLSDIPKLSRRHQALFSRLTFWVDLKIPPSIMHDSPFGIYNLVMIEVRRLICCTYVSVTYLWRLPTQISFLLQVSFFRSLSCLEYLRILHCRFVNLLPLFIFWRMNFD